MVGIVRVLFGVLFMALLIFPFGVYHSMVGPFISGCLWGFKLPVGYVGFIVGLLLILYPKLPFAKSVGFGHFLMIGAAFVLISLWAPGEVFINLWHGTSIPYDVDYYSVHAFPVRLLCILGLIIGIREILLKRCKRA